MQWMSGARAVGTMTDKYDDDDDVTTTGEGRAETTFERLGAGLRFNGPARDWTFDVTLHLERTDLNYEVFARGAQRPIILEGEFSVLNGGSLGAEIGLNYPYAGAPSHDWADGEDDGGSAYLFVTFARAFDWVW